MHCDDLGWWHVATRETRAAGALTAARTAYTADLTIAQKLADADPTNTQWQRDLAVALERLENLD